MLLSLFHTKLSSTASLPLSYMYKKLNFFDFQKDYASLTAESEEELESLLMKAKEESEKASLKLNIQKMKIMASGPITSWKIDGEIMEIVTDFTFLGSKITLTVTAAMKLEDV